MLSQLLRSIHWSCVFFLPLDEIKRRQLFKAITKHYKTDQNLDNLWTAVFFFSTSVCETHCIATALPETMLKRESPKDSKGKLRCREGVFHSGGLFCNLDNTDVLRCCKCCRDVGCGQPSSLSCNMVQNKLLTLPLVRNLWTTAGGSPSHPPVRQDVLPDPLESLVPGREFRGWHLNQSDAIPQPELWPQHGKFPYWLSRARLWLPSSSPCVLRK